LALPAHEAQRVIEYLKICRPDHWLKNVFILFGHVVALTLVMDFHFRQRACLAGGAVPGAGLSQSLPPNYVLNEILDAPFDAMHPRSCAAFRRAR